MSLFAELAVIQPVWTMLRTRFDAIRDDERGYSMEAVIVIALLAAAALAAFAIVASKINDKASNISTS